MVFSHQVYEVMCASVGLVDKVGFISKSVTLLESIGRSVLLSEFEFTNAFYYLDRVEDFEANEKMCVVEKHRKLKMLHTRLQSSQKARVILWEFLPIPLTSS